MNIFKKSITAVILAAFVCTQVNAVSLYPSFGYKGIEGIFKKVKGMFTTKRIIGGAIFIGCGALACIFLKKWLNDVADEGTVVAKRKLYLDEERRKKEKLTRTLFSIFEDASLNIFSKDTDLSRMRDKIAIELIEKGADVNAKDQDGDTPLILACHKRLERIAMILIEKGANVNVKDKDENTPLILACDRCLIDSFYHGMERIVMKLIEKGADVSAKSKYGLTPLLAVSNKGLENLAIQLIEKGADVCWFNTYET